MSSKSTSLFLLLFLFSFSLPLSAQVFDELEVSTGVAIYQGDVPQYALKTSIFSSLKVGLRKRLSPKWSLYANLGYLDFDNVSPSRANGFQTRILEGNIVAQYFPFRGLNKSNSFPFFLHGGLGLSTLSTSIFPTTNTTLIERNTVVPIHVGCGVQIFFIPQVGFTFYSNWRYTKNDEIDGVTAANNSDFYADLNFGAIFKIGR